VVASLARHIVIDAAVFEVNFLKSLTMEESSLSPAELIIKCI